MKNILTFLFIISATFVFAQDSGTDSTSTDSTVIVEASSSVEATSSSTDLPSITLKDIEGNEINLADYGTNGKLTVISFWATWCKPCIRELKNLNELAEEWEEDYGVEIIIVSVDDARNMQKVKPFVNGRGWDFDALLDPNGDLQRAMNVANPPVTFLIDKNGKIVYTHTGYVEGDEYELEEHIQEATASH